MTAPPAPSLPLRARNVSRSTAIAERLEVADGLWGKFMGLMGRPGLEPDSGLWLTGSNGIHMMFMRFPIDAVFLDRASRVLKVAAALPPWRAAACRGSRTVLELPAGEAARQGLRPGVSLTQVWRSEPASRPRPQAPASARPG